MLIFGLLLALVAGGAFLWGLSLIAADMKNCPPRLLPGMVALVFAMLVFLTSLYAFSLAEVGKTRGYHVSGWGSY